MGFTCTIQRKVGPGRPLKRPVDKGTAPNQSIMATDSGADTPTTTGDPRFNKSAYEPSGSQILAGDLTDVGRGYFVIPYYFCVFDGASGISSKAILQSMVMGQSASGNGKQYTGTVDGRRIECVYADPDDNMGTIGCRVQLGMPLPDTPNQDVAEFGSFIGNENTDDCVGNGGSLLVVPITNEQGTFSQANPTIDDHGGGGILGNVNTDIYAVGTLSVTESSQVTDDLDIEKDHSDLIIHPSRRNERWLVFQWTDVEKRGSFPSADSRVIRWMTEFNGEDFTNVRTNTTTGGSTKNGRGYSWSIPINNFNRIWSCQFRVMDNLPVDREIPGKTYLNMWDASRNTGNPTRLVSSLHYLLRAEAFSAFDFYESRIGVVTNSDTWQDSDFVTTLECDGSHPVYLGFSTSVHQFEGQTRFRITRDGTPISPDGTDYVTFGQWDQLTHIGGSNGSGDTDNDTLPYSLLWFDNPTAGEHTYRIQYRRNSGFTGSNNAMWNTRDDGSDGFIGTMFAAEMGFPTRQPY